MQEAMQKGADAILIEKLDTTETGYTTVENKTADKEKKKEAADILVHNGLYHAHRERPRDHRQASEIPLIRQVSIIVTGKYPMRGHPPGPLPRCSLSQRVLPGTASAHGMAMMESV